MRLTSAQQLTARCKVRNLRPVSDLSHFRNFCDFPPIVGFSGEQELLYQCADGLWWTMRWPLDGYPGDKFGDDERVFFGHSADRTQFPDEVGFNPTVWKAKK